MINFCQIETQPQIQNFLRTQTSRSTNTSINPLQKPFRSHPLEIRKMFDSRPYAVNLSQETSQLFKVGGAIGLEYIWEEGPRSWDAPSANVCQAELMHGGCTGRNGFFLICIAQDYRSPTYGPISHWTRKIRKKVFSFGITFEKLVFFSCITAIAELILTRLRQRMGGIWGSPELDGGVSTPWKTSLNKPKF